MHTHVCFNLRAPQMPTYALSPKSDLTAYQNLIFDLAIGSYHFMHGKCVSLDSGAGAAMINTVLDGVHTILSI